MKIVKIKGLLIAVFMFVFYNTIEFTSSNSMSFGLLKKNNKKFEDNKNDSKQIFTHNQISDKSVYFEGWIKYLHYSENEKDKPKAFFKNSFFAEQERNPNLTNMIKLDKVFFK